MKKVLVFVLMVIAFGACSKDDNDSGNSIKKATVKGAQLIYENSVETRAGTRATTEEVQRFMTVDNQGNVKPIRFITESGDTLDMDIQKVKNLNDAYLLLSGYFKFNGLYIPHLLANKNTELIYAINEEFYLSNELPIFSDDNSNSYVPIAENIKKFNLKNPSNITMENYITDNQNIHKYWVNGKGTCFYNSNIGLKFQCSGGRFYNIKALVSDFDNFNIFHSLNDCFYVVNDKLMNSEQGLVQLLKIYKIEEIGNDELKSYKVADLSTTDYLINIHFYEFCPNPIKKTHIISNGEITYEFDETTNEFRKLDFILPETHYIGWGTYRSNAFLTSEALWVHDDTKLYRLNLADYSLNIIDLIKEGYEIKKENITCSINAPGLSFSGLRYSDGQNIVGTINEDGTITAFEKTKTSNKITTLLRLN